MRIYPYDGIKGVVSAPPFWHGVFILKVTAEREADIGDSHGRIALHR